MSFLSNFFFSLDLLCTPFPSTESRFLVSSYNILYYQILVVKFILKQCEKKRGYYIHDQISIYQKYHQIKEE